jgi:hypothetical protein
MTLPTLPKLKAFRTIVAAIALLVRSRADAARALPNDNPGAAVLATLPTGETGSGFYLNTGKAMFLVTATHVLFDKHTKALRSSNAMLLSYPRDINATDHNTLSVSLGKLLLILA